MARWGLWTATAIGAAGAGAGLALLRRRRPAEAIGSVDPDEAAAPAPPPAAADPTQDPQEALDAARERLRARADALRRQIEDEGEGPSTTG